MRIGVLRPWRDPNTRLPAASSLLRPFSRLESFDGERANVEDLFREALGELVDFRVPVPRQIDGDPGASQAMRHIRKLEQGGARRVVEGGKYRVLVRSLGPPVGDQPWEFRVTMDAARGRNLDDCVRVSLNGSTMTFRVGSTHLGSRARPTRLVGVVEETSAEIVADVWALVGEHSLVFESCPWLWKLEGARVSVDIVHLGQRVRLPATGTFELRSYGYPVIPE
jgi:hypothetical protein